MLGRFGRLRLQWWTQGPRVPLPQYLRLLHVAGEVNIAQKSARDALTSRYGDPGFHKHVDVAKILGLISEQTVFVYVGKLTSSPSTRRQPRPAHQHDSVRCRARVLPGKVSRAFRCPSSKADTQSRKHCQGAESSGRDRLQASRKVDQGPGALVA